MNISNDIILQAVEGLRSIPGLMAELRDGGEPVLEVCFESHRALYLIQSIDPITAADMAELLTRRSTEPLQIIIGRHVRLEASESLRKAGISYCDLRGNAFLKTNDFVIYMHESRKLSRQMSPVHPAGRAFEPSGLKMILPLLVDPARVNETYRDLAARVDVAPASVKHALDDLEQKGFVLKIGRGRGMKRRLMEVPALIRRWSVAYGDRLRPKLLRRRFRFLDPEALRDWRKLPLNPIDSCWGGEPATALYTRYLRPEILTIYSTATTSALVQALRILPDPEGPLEVLTKFWKDDVETIDGLPVVPKVLAYADLLASNATRNLEVAPLLVKPDSDVSHG